MFALVADQEAVVAEPRLGVLLAFLAAGQAAFALEVRRLHVLAVDRDGRGADVERGPAAGGRAFQGRVGPGARQLGRGARGRRGQEGVGWVTDEHAHVADLTDAEIPGLARAAPDLGDAGTPGVRAVAPLLPVCGVEVDAEGPTAAAAVGHRARHLLTVLLAQGRERDLFATFALVVVHPFGRGDRGLGPVGAAVLVESVEGVVDRGWSRAVDLEHGPGDEADDDGEHDADRDKALVPPEGVHRHSIPDPRDGEPG